jgi:hypothetical protein
VRARLLLEPVLGLAQMTERGPRVGGTTRHFAAAEVLCGDATVRDRSFELVRRLLVKASGRLEAFSHLVLAQGSKSLTSAV